MSPMTFLQKLPGSTEPYAGCVANRSQNTETPGDWQPAFYPTYPGECADAQAQPRWEDNEGLPGAYMPAVAFHKYQGPIDGSCRPGEGIYAPEFLRSTYVKGFDGSTSQSIASAVVFHDSSLAGCFGVHSYQPVPRTGSGMPDPERVATSLGQLRHRKVSGGPATCLTLTSSPPGPTTLPNGSCSSKDMYMVSPRPYPFPEHRPTANPQHGEAEIRSHLGAASMSNVIPEQEKPAGSETAKTGDWRKRTMTGEELRAITDTSQLSACIRCRMQRLRCEVDPEDYQGPCLTCSRVDMSSGKVVHQQPCIRIKLSDVVLYIDPSTAHSNTQGLPVKACGPRQWHSETTHQIHLMMRGLCSVPMVIEVRRFIETPGDKVHYIWLDEGSGEVQETALEPYALVSVEETRKVFEKYVDANAVGSWEETTKRGNASQLIQEHYRTALEHYRKVGNVGRLVDERLLLNFFKLRLALRVSMHPSWVYDRNDKSVYCLGMAPAKGDFHPLLNRVPTPPTITEQLNSISHGVMLKYHKQVLEDLEKICCKKIRTSFFTVYVVVFLMLHGLAVATEHHRLDAPLCCGTEQKQRRQDGYLAYLNTVKKSSHILLLHWQYYRRAPNSLCPADGSTVDHITKWFWPGLSSEHERFCQENWKKMREMQEDARCLKQRSFGSPFYWISQMFDDDWSLEDFRP
ncbi:Tetratricopeptide repeat domain containing protein [Colletotrichum higginsianum IMI 349063]|uniref:Tetratricopeptide repeat domain containing protein n=1 Tax=Colletotrichum higginsianum (strain IMI 349063) TaxID=759273 RepID=A0A1B7XQW6_COLHI|nr:Tetratricopeptide repeat domain containing protein [Colletotrichum higginsianum IMI 349063]OBR02162.1 Tetratricopeptide repeat domain containing protein [Colletotrichum higginsianum IMI 349063]